MTNERTPSEGEKSGEGGYWSQNHISAELIYDALRKDELDFIILLNPEADKLDDFGLSRSGIYEAYQIKDWSSAITYNSFISKIKKKRDGTFKEKESPIISLRNGWKSLSPIYGENRLKLFWVSTQKLSHQNLKIIGTDIPVQFHSFYADILSKIIKDPQNFVIPSEYLPIWKNFTETLDLEEAELKEFLSCLEFHFEYQLDANNLTFTQKKNKEEINHIIASLMRKKKESIDNQGIRLYKKELIHLLHWEGLFEYDIITLFPEPKTKYISIEQSKTEILQKNHEKQRGYIALLGGPGTGKSTLLNHFIRDIPNSNKYRTFYYFAYSPDTYLSLQNISESNNFLKSMVLEIRKKGFEISTISSKLEDFRTEFRKLLTQLKKNYIQTRIKNIFIIDGLDHIPREFDPSSSFLKEFLLPNQIPNGIYFVIGTQTENLSQIPTSVREELNDESNRVDISQISKEGLGLILENEGIEYSQTILDQLYSICNGHPLYIQYIIRQLENSNEGLTMDFLYDFDVLDLDIKKYYQKLWSQIAKNQTFKEYFGLISRIVGSLEDDFILYIGGPELLSIINENYKYLFNRSLNCSTIFHNSFKIFCQKTSAELNGKCNTKLKKYYHEQLIEFYSSYSTNKKKKFEMIPHLYHLKDFEKIFTLSNQTWFRDQFYSFRPKKTIQEELAKLTKISLEQKRYFIFFRSLLSQYENMNRSYNLKEKAIIHLLLKQGNVLDAFFIADTVDCSYWEENEEVMAIARIFYEFDYKEQCIKLMEKAAPTDLLIRNELDLHNNESIKYFEDWFFIGIDYYTPEKILELLMNAKPKYRNPAVPTLEIIRLFFKTLLQTKKIEIFETLLANIKLKDERLYLNVLMIIWKTLFSIDIEKGLFFFNEYLQILNKYQLHYSPITFLDICDGYIYSENYPKAIDWFNRITPIINRRAIYNFEDFEAIIRYIDMALILNTQNPTELCDFLYSGIKSKRKKKFL